MWKDALTILRRVGGLPLNVLILGDVTPAQRNEALHEFRAASGQDAYRLQGTTPFELPMVPIHHIVIDQVADLSADDQETLVRWLDLHLDTTILSFANEPLFSLVTDGACSERLFYRLNMVTLRVDDDTGDTR